MKNILIGGAWPYANGSLHIGHIAALLPGDVLARFHRARGDRVFYVSGSDCHGTPVTVRAQKEGRTPREISDAYHAEFCRVFDRLGFSYDRYIKTSDEEHKAFVREFHKKIYESPYVGERTVKQAHCPVCKKVLTDRQLVGKCPSCGRETRGDQCDACGEIIDAELLPDAACALCGSAPEYRETKQLFLLISKLEGELREFLESRPHWRKNAAAFTQRYIGEGLRDRAITRDLEWGIDVPREGYGNKRIYIWAENVLGYLSAAKLLCTERGIPFSELFGENARHCYVHGKDNIPFHTVILPSLLLAHGEDLRLPDDIFSSEYVTLEGEKISTSRNHAVWAHELAEKYSPDAIRFFFIANGPEKRDSDFSESEFIRVNNSELAGVWGNFVNRTLAFIQKYLGGEVPNGTPLPELRKLVTEAYGEVGKNIENGRFKNAVNEAFELVRHGNRYYDSARPWTTRESDPEACKNAIFNCTYLVANCAALLAPFLPFTSEKVLGWLGADCSWREKTVPGGTPVRETEILFRRIGK